MTDLCGSFGNVVPLLQFRAFLFFYKESCRFLIPQEMEYVEKFFVFPILRLSIRRQDLVVACDATLPRSALGQRAYSGTFWTPKFKLTAFFMHSFPSPQILDLPLLASYS